MESYARFVFFIFGVGVGFFIGGGVISYLWKSGICQEWAERHAG